MVSRDSYGASDRTTSRACPLSAGDASKTARYCWRNRAGPTGRSISRGSVPGPPRRPAMSLKATPIDPVPAATARGARAAFRKGNPLRSLRDELGAIFADADFADLFPQARPARAGAVAAGPGHL